MDSSDKKLTDRDIAMLALGYVIGVLTAGVISFIVYGHA
jgi:hypothetical protein